jgi:cell wall-associated NlpC family hydrolase
MQPINHSIRQKIITEAKSWLGTSFHHQGRIKICAAHNGGCDCIGLVVGVASNLKLYSKTGQLISNCDQTNYSPLPNGNDLYNIINAHLLNLGKDLSKAQIGDIALFSFAKNPQHVAIISEQIYDQVKHLSIIHAYSIAGKVCEHHLDQKWQKRLVRLYSFPQLGL